MNIIFPCIFLPIKVAAVQYMPAIWVIINFGSWSLNLLCAAQCQTVQSRWHKHLASYVGDTASSSGTTTQTYRLHPICRIMWRHLLQAIYCANKTVLQQVDFASVADWLKTISDIKTSKETLKLISPNLFSVPPFFTLVLLLPVAMSLSARNIDSHYHRYCAPTKPALSCCGSTWPQSKKNT